MASEDQQQTKPPESPAPGAAMMVAPGVLPAYGNPEWASSMQAFYAGGAAGHPFMWPTQPMIASPYGGGIPFSPMYPHPGAYYPHPAAMSMAMANSAGEGLAAEEKNKGDSRHTPSSRSGESGSGGDDSSDTGDKDGEQKDQSSPKRRRCDAENANGYVATTHGSSHMSKGRSAAKLPVSAPGRAVLPGPATNLNMGMDIWHNPHQLPAAPGSVGTATAVAAHDGIVSHRLVCQDEREMKKEKRKQSNRESARRSRLRKQQECEQLAKKVNELTVENSALKEEINQLKKACEEMEVQNSKLVAKQVGEPVISLGIRPSLPKAPAS